MTDMPELTEAELGQWRELPAATIADCLGRCNVVPARLRPVGGAGMLGPAFGVRVMSGDSAPPRRALNHVPPGRVLAVDAGGYADRAAGRPSSDVLGL